MKVITAIDSFKGSLTSLEAGEAVKRGILKVYPKADVEVCPLADGGEGTVEALVSGMGGIIHTVKVTGPLGEKIFCQYGMIENSKTAVMEMAGAAGITLIPEEKRNPLYTTTYGVGEVIKDAVLKGCRRFLIGIGGSATNDGGAGMLQALGFGFLDSKGNPISFGAAGLKELKKITNDSILEELQGCQFQIACDVTNPLCGELGCSAVYGPQKGADDTMIKEMDEWLQSYAELTKTVYPDADDKKPGAGAAGGLGFAFASFLNAELKSGIEIVLEETKLETYVKDADIVVTGEGCMDGQTAMGKAPIGVAKIAHKYKKPVIALAGCVTPSAVKCNQQGIDAFFPVLRSAVSLEEAMDSENAKKNVEDTTEQVFRLWSAASKR